MWLHVWASTRGSSVTLGMSLNLSEVTFLTGMEQGTALRIQCA